MNALVIFIKYPVAGAVKTRLGAQVGHDLAADLYRIFIEQTFELSRNSSAELVYVAYDPKVEFEKYHPLLPADFFHFPQNGDNLGHRMFNAFNLVFSQGARRVIILGSDSPTLPVKYLDDTFKSLNAVDLVLGPAEDGGYYLIGLKQLHKALFENIEWSSTAVLKSTLAQARSLSISHSLLPNLYDVDELETLKRAVKDDASGKIKACLQNCDEFSFEW